MKFAITPSYKDIFKEEAPDINTLLSDIPSKAIITLLSAINSNLNFEPNNVETQRKIFRFWTQRFNQQQQEIVFQGMLPFLRASDSPTFFATWYLTEFIQRELIHYRDLDIEDTTPDQEFRLFKAYLIIVEMCNDNHSKVLKERVKRELSHEYRFQELTWPMLAGQHEINGRVDPVYQVSKTLVLLKYLSEQEKTAKYVGNFLLAIKRESLLHYVFDLMALVNVSFQHDESKIFKPYLLVPESGFEILFEHWAIDREELSSAKDKQIDYKGMREKPLFKVSDGKYVVMNWNFLYNQLNLGLLFLFHKISGIDEVYKKFIDFRSHVAKEVSEAIIFHGIVSKALVKKHSLTVFDATGSNKLPDCYHREGKYVLLFEFKDVLMPATTIGSCHYDTIKADIDKKFIESDDGKKGIRQILKQIIQLNEGETYGDDFEKKGIKRRNIVIYPVIVFTHFMYSMPGINTYLNSIFRKEMDDYIKSNKLNLGQVRDVVMIDLEFLFRNFLSLQKNEKNLIDLLDSYMEKMKRAKERARKKETTENVILANSCFEEFNYGLGARPKKYVEELFDALGIAV